MLRLDDAVKSRNVMLKKVSFLGSTSAGSLISYVRQLPTFPSLRPLRSGEPWPFDVPPLRSLHKRGAGTGAHTPPETNISHLGEAPRGTTEPKSRR